MDETALFSQLDTIIAKYDNSKERLIQILLDLQKSSEQNYLSEECLEYVAEKLNLKESQVYEVATFYSMLNHKPKGRYVIEICNSAPCHVCGSQKVIDILEELLGIKIGETTADGMFTLHQVSCFGACEISPAIKIDNKVYGNITKEKIESVIRILKYIGGNERGKNIEIDF